MNGPDEMPAQPEGASEPIPEIIPAAPERGPLFERTDWSSFAISTALTLAVYLSTLAPEVTLEYSGILSVGATYAGVPHPPGYPLWTLYAWLFANILPFSNIAWRVAVSSAVAAALTCGIVALMVSRGGAAIFDGIPEFKRLEPRDERLLRVASGCVAGMLFGLDRAFWREAVIVETWALTLLLFAGVLCLLMRWSYAPEQTRYLCAAALVYGLAMSNSQSLAIAAPGFLFIILFGNPALGRDFMLATALLLTASLLAHALSGFFLTYWPTYRKWTGSEARTFSSQ
jgi:hypothetical protein